VIVCDHYNALQHAARRRAGRAAGIVAAFTRRMDCTWKKRLRAQIGEIVSMRSTAVSRIKPLFQEVLLIRKGLRLMGKEMYAIDGSPMTSCQ